MRRLLRASVLVLLWTGCFPGEYLEGTQENCEGRRCVELGEGLLEGDEAHQPDPQRAAGLITKGCNDGDLEGCQLLAMLLEEGQGVPQNLPKAAELYRYNYEHKFMASCS